MLFNDTLSFRYHIQNLIKKIISSVGIFAKAKTVFNANAKALLNLYYAIFHSDLQYGLIGWSPTYKTLSLKLCKIKPLKLLEEVNIANE